jgi:GNAT superfamily N-acetyltransferase
MEGIHARPAIEADTDRLVEAVIDQQEYERKLHDSRLPGAEIAAAYLRHVGESAAQNDGAIWVAELDGVFAGYAACWVEHECNLAETADYNRFGDVADTYVIPKLRSRGVAAHLLQAAESHLRAAGSEDQDRGLGRQCKRIAGLRQARLRDLRGGDGKARSSVKSAQGYCFAASDSPGLGRD